MPIQTRHRRHHRRNRALSRERRRTARPIVQPGAAAAPAFPGALLLGAVPAAAPAAAPAAPAAGAIVPAAAAGRAPAAPVPQPAAAGTPPQTLLTIPPRTLELIALLNARVNLDLIWPKYEANANNQIQQNLTALATVMDPVAFHQQRVLIEQTKKALHTARVDKTADADWVDDSAAELIATHRPAAELLESQLKLTLQQQDQPGRKMLTLLDKWEAVAGAKPGRAEKAAQPRKKGKKGKKTKPAGKGKTGKPKAKGKKAKGKKP
jgi:hypothetical protein